MTILVTHAAEKRGAGEAHFMWGARPRRQRLLFVHRDGPHAAHPAFSHQLSPCLTFAALALEALGCRDRERAVRWRITTSAARAGGCGRRGFYRSWKRVAGCACSAKRDFGLQIERFGRLLTAPIDGYAHTVSFQTSRVLKPAEKPDVPPPEHPAVAAVNRRRRPFA